MTTPKQYTTQELKVASILKKPEFYRSMTNTPALNRFGSNLNTGSNLFRVTEFIEGRGDSGSITVFYTNLYKIIPLVQGLKLQRNGKWSTFIQQDELVTVLADRVIVQTSALDSGKDTIYFKARVISLDNVRNGNY